MLRLLTTTAKRSRDIAARTARANVTGAVAAAALCLLAGCASPGVPRPPSLHLPAPVRDLSAVRTGGTVALHFTTPTETTDHQPLRHKGQPVPLTATLCRVQGAACLPVTRLSVMPGEAVDAVDTLSPALTVGVARPVGYRVRVANAAGRDAGESRESLAAAGVVPPGIRDVAASVVAQGIELTWHADPAARDAIRVEATTEATGAAEPPAFGKASPRTGEPTARLLQIRPAPRDPGGAIDPAPAVGTRTVYRVYRERELVAGGQTLPLRGEVATVTAMRSGDVFAPAAPLGLLAVSFLTENGGASVSLSWEANGESDVAGYFVYRAIGTGEFVRVTGQPVRGVSFQDTAATGLAPGMHVRYAVTAVDRNGNESGKSAVIEADVR